MQFYGPSLCQNLMVDNSTASGGALNSAGYSAYGVHQSITSATMRAQITVGIVCATWPSWVFGFANMRYSI